MEYSEFTRMELKREEILREGVRRRLARCPAGYLQVRPHRSGLQYYHQLPGGERPRYLNRSQIPLRNELAYKRVLTEMAARLDRNIEALEAALSQWKPYDYTSAAAALPKSYEKAVTEVREEGVLERGSLNDRALCEGPGAGGLSADGQVIRGAWTDDQGRPVFRQSQNPYKPEHLIHSNTFGLLTRSKGESMWAEVIYAAGLPVLYEQRLVLRTHSGRMVERYPDFTFPFASPLYLEHKGKMQDEDYAQRDLRTTQLYHLNGIYPPKNLIITMDGPDGAFSSADMERLLRGYIMK